MANFEQWYSKTFYHELSMLDTEVWNAKQQQQQSQQIVPFDEAKIFRRRIVAVDSVETLAVPMLEIQREDWEKDVDVCRGCTRNLGWLQFRPKHHCRFCGKTFCNDCAFGDIRICNPCEMKRARFQTLQLLRIFEREAVRNPTKENVVSVARAYRIALQAFANEKDESFAQEARLILIEGLQSFLELIEAQAMKKKKDADSNIA